MSAVAPDESPGLDVGHYQPDRNAWSASTLAKTLYRGLEDEGAEVFVELENGCKAAVHFRGRECTRTR